jgi:hypothetical protein
MARESDEISTATPPTDLTRDFIGTPFDSVVGMSVATRTPHVKEILASARHARTAGVPVLSDHHFGSAVSGGLTWTLFRSPSAHVGDGRSRSPILSRVSMHLRVPLCLSSCDFVAVGSGGEAAFVGDHDAPDVVGDPWLQASRGFVAGLAFGDLLVEVGPPDAVAIRTWVTAIRWIAEFSRRSPLRESRCRVCSPLAISIGATPA